MEYGEGSVYYNKSLDRWVARYSPRKGAKPKYLYGKTEAEVTKKLRAYKRSPEALVQTDAVKVNTEFYFTNWLTTYKKPSLKPSSYDRLDTIIRKHIAPNIGKISIGDVTPDDCQKLLNKLTDEGFSYSTVKKVYDTMAACFKHAAVKEDITKDPMIVVSSPSQRNYETKDTRALTVEEQQRLMAELERRWSSSQRYIYNYRDAYILMLNTGLREGEIVALDWTDIDFKEQTLSVTKNAIWVKERSSDGEPTGKSVQIVQPSTKTQAGRRVIPLNKAAMEALQRLRAEHPESPYVLTTENGERTHNHTLNKQLSRAYARAMIPNATVHTLRHTFATRLFEKGADVKDVSVLLGHSGVGITYNTYVHVIKKRKEDVVGLLDAEDENGAG